MSAGKLIPYSTQWIDKDDIYAVVRVLRSDWITQGPKIAEFEKKLAAYCGARYAVAVSSGTAALHIACLCAGIKKGDEAITSPITFAASANCVLYCGGRPVFSDIQHDTGNIDPLKIEENITKRTRAIIPVHFAGHPCDLKEIRTIAKRHKLAVIEDAAHALGAEYKGGRIGSCKYSDMTIFSFHPLKSITTGEGGAVLTNSRDLYGKLMMLRNHGITKDESACKRYDGPWYYEMQHLGLNYRITDMQCALGASQLKRLGRFIGRRRELAGLYNKAFLRTGGIILPVRRGYVKSSWHLYAIRLEAREDNGRKRKEIFNYLRANKIGVQVHYIPVYRHPFYQRLGYKAGTCPIAEDYYERVISLPLYPGMKDADVKYVAAMVARALGKFC